MSNSLPTQGCHAQLTAHLWDHWDVDRAASAYKWTVLGYKPAITEVYHSYVNKGR